MMLNRRKKYIVTLIFFCCIFFFFFLIICHSFSFFLSFFFFFKKEGVLSPDFFFFSLRGEAISVSVAFEVSPSPSEKVRLPSVSSPLNVWSPSNVELWAPAIEESVASARLLESIILLYSASSSADTLSNGLRLYADLYTVAWCW